MALKSVLPPDLEAKRIAIAKEHNKLVLFLSLGLFVLLFAAVLLAPRRPPPTSRFIAGFLVIGSIEAYGIYRIIQHDKTMCTRMGFICQHCGEPLYEPRASIHLNGRCPKCGGSVLG